MKTLKPKFDLLYDEDRTAADLFNVRTGEVLSQIDFSGEFGVKAFLENGASISFTVDASGIEKKAAIIKAVANFIKQQKKKLEEAKAERQDNA